MGSESRFLSTVTAEYSVYIYEAGDSTLPSGMTDMYPDGEFSLIIIG